MGFDTTNCLGGSATVMGYSDIYNWYAAGRHRCAENNVTALRDHGDATQHTDEHTRIPDMVVIASNVWNKFSDESPSCPSAPRPATQ